MDKTQMYVEKFCNSLHVQMKPLNIVQQIDQLLIDKHSKSDINQGLLQLHAFIDSIYSKMGEEPELFFIPDYILGDTQKPKDKKEERVYMITKEESDKYEKETKHDREPIGRKKFG